MEIFSRAFKQSINKRTVCRVKGHDVSEWMQDHWAPGHSTGSEVRVCLRCGLEINRRGLQVTVVDKMLIEHASMGPDGFITIGGIILKSHKENGK